MLAALVVMNFACGTNASVESFPKENPQTEFDRVALPIPKHVLTWAYDDANAGGNGATSTQVQAFTNWAEETTHSPPGKAENDCYPGAGAVSCQAVAYLRATRAHAQATPDSYMIAQLNAERLTNDVGFYHNALHTAADRVNDRTGPCAPAPLPSLGPCYYPRISDPSVYRFVSTCIIQGGLGSSCGGHTFSGPREGTEFMEDVTPGTCENPKGFGNYFLPGSSTLNPVETEPGCDTRLQSDIKTYLAGLTWTDNSHARAFLNGYAPLCPNGGCAFPAGALTFWASGSVPALGVVDEASVCPSATSPVIGFVGANVMDDMAQLFNEVGAGYFVFLNYSTAQAGSAAQLRMRRYCDGIFWLGYNISRSVLWSNYSNGYRTPGNANILAVYPEQQVVPTKPMRSMSGVTTSTFGFNGTGCNASHTFDTNMVGGAHDLVVACGIDNDATVAGVYVREFRQCYSWGSLIGAGQCAVVVNMTNAAVTIGGLSGKPWKYPDGNAALTQDYNGMLILLGKDVVTDGCSTATGCPTGRGADLNFGGSFSIHRTTIKDGDAAFLFHS